MNIHDTIEKWKNRLGMEEFQISAEEINREQVVFPDDITEEDRYFVGIEPKSGVISHDRDLTELDIVHEMFHLGFPDSSEEFVNRASEQLMEQFNGVD